MEMTAKAKHNYSICNNFTFTCHLFPCLNIISFVSFSCPLLLVHQPFFHSIPSQSNSSHPHLPFYLPSPRAFTPVSLHPSYFNWLFSPFHLYYLSLLPPHHTSHSLSLYPIPPHSYSLHFFFPFPFHFYSHVMPTLSPLFQHNTHVLFLSFYSCHTKQPFLSLHSYQYRASSQSFSIPTSCILLSFLPISLPSFLAAYLPHHHLSILLCQFHTNTTAFRHYYPWVSATNLCLTSVHSTLNPPNNPCPYHHLLLAPLFPIYASPPFFL